MANQSLRDKGYLTDEKYDALFQKTLTIQFISCTDIDTRYDLVFSVTAENLGVSENELYGRIRILRGYNEDTALSFPDNKIYNDGMPHHIKISSNDTDFFRKWDKEFIATIKCNGLQSNITKFKLPPKKEKKAEEPVETTDKPTKESVPIGVTDYHTKNGIYIGSSDGNVNARKQKAIVFDNSEIETIKANQKNGKTTPLEDVNSAKILPSDAALQASIDVYTATTKPNWSDTQGGLHGESAIVFTDGHTEKGKSGQKGTVEKDGYFRTHEELPDIPAKYSEDDIEVIIHSHATGYIRYRAENDNSENGKWYSGNAQAPSQTDENNPLFISKTNIIVGPLGKIDNSEELYMPKEKPHGIVIYPAGSTIADMSLNIDYVKKMRVFN